MNRISITNVWIIPSILILIALPIIGKIDYIVCVYGEHLSFLDLKFPVISFLFIVYGSRSFPALFVLLVFDLFVYPSMILIEYVAQLLAVIFSGLFFHLFIMEGQSDFPSCNKKFICSMFALICINTVTATLFDFFNESFYKNLIYFKYFYTIMTLKALGIMFTYFVGVFMCSVVFFTFHYLCNKEPFGVK